MSGYVMVYCGKCEHEYKIKDFVILSWSGRKDILCSTCGDVLIIKEGVKLLKVDIQNSLKLSDIRQSIECGGME